MRGTNKKTTPKHKAKVTGSSAQTTDPTAFSHMGGALLPEANTAPDGHCLTVADGEMSRPNTGEPCDDGRDDDRVEE